MRSRDCALHELSTIVVCCASVELGQPGSFPIKMVVPTKNGTIKLTISYSALENNFLLSVNGMPATLMPRADENPAERK